MSELDVVVTDDDVSEGISDRMAPFMAGDALLFVISVSLLSAHRGLGLWRCL